MTIDDKVRDENQQHNINKEEILALSSRKIDKYEYLTDKGILRSNQRKIIGQAKFLYSPLGF